MRSEWHWFVRCDLQIFSGCVSHLEQLHAQSPFLFPIVFSINLHPRCSCHFIFKTFDFFGRNLLVGQILQCPHDEGRLLLGEEWSTCTSLMIQHCTRRCPMSSRLSFLFGSLQKLRRLWTRSRVVSAAPSLRVSSTRCKTARRECVTTSLKI